MRLPWSVVLAFGVGILLIWALGRLFLVPRRLIWRVFASALFGGICLWLVNAIAGRFGLNIAINPLTALCVGTLGLPGLGLLFALGALL